MTVPERPLLAPWYRIVGDGERLLLEHAQSLVVLTGAAVRTLLPALLPLLDGTRTVDELVARLGPPARPAIEAALELLTARRIVVEGPDVPADVRTAACAIAAAYGLSPSAAAEALRSTSIAVVGGGLMRLDVLRLLHDAGVGEIRTRGWRGRRPAGLTVVIPAHDELDRLSGWNRTALGTRAAWLLVRPHDGRFTSVGPLFLPGRTCCYECLLLRRGANSGYAAEIAEVEAAPLAAVVDAGLDAFAAALAAHVAVRYAVAADNALPGVLFTLESQPAVLLRDHAVLRVPRCPACSPVRAAPPLPWHEVVAA